MPKSTVKPSQCKINNGQRAWRVWVPKKLQGQHNATRRFFKTRTAAEEFAREMNQSGHGWGQRLLALPDNTQGRLLRCLDRLNGNIELLERLTEQATQLALPDDTQCRLLRCLERFSGNIELLEKATDQVTQEEIDLNCECAEGRRKPGSQKIREYQQHKKQTSNLLQVLAVNQLKL
jgi:hypothetical protein